MQPDILYDCGVTVRLSRDVLARRWFSVFAKRFAATWMGRCRPRRLAGWMRFLRARRCRWSRTGGGCTHRDRHGRLRCRRNLRRGFGRRFERGKRRISGARVSSVAARSWLRCRRRFGASRGTLLDWHRKSLACGGCLRRLRWTRASAARLRACAWRTGSFARTCKRRGRGRRSFRGRLRSCARPGRRWRSRALAARASRFGSRARGVSWRRRRKCAIRRRRTGSAGLAAHPMWRTVRTFRRSSKWMSERTSACFGGGAGGGPATARRRRERCRRRRLRGCSRRRRTASASGRASCTSAMPVSGRSTGSRHG